MPPNRYWMKKSWKLTCCLTGKTGALSICSSLRHMTNQWPPFGSIKFKLPWKTKQTFKCSKHGIQFFQLRLSINWYIQIVHKTSHFLERSSFYTSFNEWGVVARYRNSGKSSRTGEIKLLIICTENSVRIIFGLWAPTLNMQCLFWKLQLFLAWRWQRESLVKRGLGMLMTAGPQQMSGICSQDCSGLIHFYRSWTIITVRFFLYAVITVIVTLIITALYT